MKRQQRDTKSYSRAKSPKIVQNSKEGKNISELPAEILLKIFGYLPAHDILSLDRVSKKFQVLSREPKMITRVNFSEMTGRKVPLLFVPGDKFKQILGFLKFLESERTKNVTSLDVTYDIFDKAINYDSWLIGTYIKNWWSEELRTRTSRMRDLFTSLGQNAWPCPNLKEFGFVLSAHHHKFQLKSKRNGLFDVHPMIQNMVRTNEGKDLFDRGHDPSHSTLYQDVLKIKTIIVMNQNL